MWSSAEIALAPDYQNDALSLGLSELLLLGYHVVREGKDILAVQTLRNSTMAATFLASTAVLMAPLSRVYVLYRLDRARKIPDAAGEVAPSPNP